jgi:hypothetical protein
MRQLTLEQRRLLGPRAPFHVGDIAWGLNDEILAEPAAQTASAFEDDHELREILARQGFTKPGGPMHFLVRDLAAAAPVAPLPEGFRCRTVQESDLAERVAVHRDAFAPSRVTETSYRNVMSACPYRRSLDCVVEVPDGRFAAGYLVWPSIGFEVHASMVGYSP